MIPIEELKPQTIPAALSTVGLLMIPIEELKHMPVFWFAGDHDLLMIPIEELKQEYCWRNRHYNRSFDDTY